MEKFFALLLTTTVLLGLSACSDKPATTDEQNPPTVYDGTGGLGGYSDPTYDYNSVDDSNSPSQTDDGSFGTPYEDMVENGRIRDRGTHAELMESSDIYRELYESQQKGVE